MSLGWEDKIVDPLERKVFEALSDPKWDFRTVEGIGKATKLSDTQVLSILSKYPDLIRESSIPDRYGNKLYTLRSHPVGSQEKLALARAFVIKSLR